MPCRISRFRDDGSLSNYITIFLASFKHIVHNGRRGRGRIIVLMQPVPITTNVVSSNPVDGAVENEYRLHDHIFYMLRVS
jgi:hypothetical protein